MQTKLLYLEDSYLQSTKTTVVSIKPKGDHHEVILAETVCYAEGGGQPSDKGEIVGKYGKLQITHARMKDGQVVHEGMLEGTLAETEIVTVSIDWEYRFDNMRWHSAGHLIHEVVMQLIPDLMPIKAEHGKHAYIEYEGQINPKLIETIEKQTNMLVAENRLLTTEFVTLEELQKRAAWVPAKLPKNKPLRILQIEGFNPIPDGGTQVKSTGEIGLVHISDIEQLGTLTRVHYNLKPQPQEKPKETQVQSVESSLDLGTFRSLLLELQSKILDEISQIPAVEIEQYQVHYFGTHGEATLLIKRIKDLTAGDRKSAGILVNEFKTSVEAAFAQARENVTGKMTWFDTSLPGTLPPVGHLHIVTQAISEITRIFERIGFTRVRHPEIDWDWYPFESLNMPANHPARDEWETFFIENQKFKIQNPKYSKIVLTPHTSNGQVREMEKGKLPIRMINIGKCYRRQVDVSHTPMFHQFEGLYIDKNVSIGHLKGVFDFFVKHFYGPDRITRLRPFHFQFTEPSFEIDISCGVCLGKGCKLCKEGWLELGGAGMVHPVVLKNGGINPDEYNGFAFGWGVERTYMMKAGTQLDDIRLLYSNDIRFLEQF